jgi:hypothetical protein
LAAFADSLDSLCIGTLLRSSMRLTQLKRRLILWRRSRRRSLRSLTRCNGYAGGRISLVATWRDSRNEVGTRGERPTSRFLSRLTVNLEWDPYQTQDCEIESACADPRMLGKRLEEHRLRCGTPQAGAMFTNKLGKPLDVNELSQRIIKPILQTAHIEWHGWHAFRRGLATNFHLSSAGCG